MQKAGIDTTDWARINDFCQNPKIAGKVFAKLGVKDLDALQVKLRAIMNKGGLKPAKEGIDAERQISVMTIPLTPMGQA